jgi:hypothetical protein
MTEATDGALMHLRGKNGRLRLPEVAIRDFLSKTENATATLFTSHKT